MTLKIILRCLHDSLNNFLLKHSLCTCFLFFFSSRPPINTNSINQAHHAENVAFLNVNKKYIS